MHLYAIFGFSEADIIILANNSEICPIYCRFACLILAALFAKARVAENDYDDRSLPFAVYVVM